MASMDPQEETNALAPGDMKQLLELRVAEELQDWWKGLASRSRQVPATTASNGEMNV